MNITLHGKQDFADVMKDPEIAGAVWNIQVAQCIHNDPYKTDTGGAGEEGGMMTKT